MSFTPSQTTDRSNDLERVVGGIAKSLPHTPYSAIGLNFIFLVQLPNGKSFQKWNRSLFASPYSSSVVPLEAQNARFGSYCSMDIFGTRLKLDVKPVKVNEGQSQQNPIFKPDEEAVMLNFNYHVDLQQPDSIVQIMNCIAVWGKALDKSIEIAASTLARIEKSE